MAGLNTGNYASGRYVYSIRKPGSASQYYIFFVEMPASTAPYGKLKYHLVDLSLNGGLGEVLADGVTFRDSVAHPFTAIRQPGTDNFWIVTHKPFTKQFVAGLVTSSSLNASTVVSSPGAHSDGSEYELYDLRSSHDGKKIAITSLKRLPGIWADHVKFVEVYNFDAASGGMTYHVKTTSERRAYFSTLFEVEFSSNNEVLYVLNTVEVMGLQPCSLYSSGISQYNLCYTDSITFTRNVTWTIYDFPCGNTTVLGRLQMGPDKKIYFPQTRTYQLGRIEYPNRIGTSANVRFDVHGIATIAGYDLPMFYQHYIEKAVKNNIEYSGGCYPDPLQFEITNDTIPSVQWDFGDPGSGGSNTSSLLRPQHVFSAPGKYTVTARLYNSLGALIETVTELVEIKDPTKRLLFGYPVDTTICAGQSVKLKLNVVDGIFRWYRKEEGYPTYLISVGDSIDLRDSGKYYVEMRQDDCDGCVMMDSININVLPTPYVDLGLDRNLCGGDSLRLTLYNPVGTRYLWSTGDTTSSILVKQPGTYWVRGEINNNGCIRSDTINIVGVPGVQFSFPPDTTLCNDQRLVLRPGIPNASYRWQNGSTLDSFVVTQPGSYWVRVFNSYGCTKSDTIHVAYVSAAAVNLGRDTSLCAGGSLQLQVNIPNATYLWSTGETSSSITVNSTADYWIRVDNGTCVVTDTIKVNFAPRPIVNLGSDTSLCIGQSLVLRTGVVNASHIWKNGSTADTLLITQPGQYWVQVTRNGCIVRDTIDVNYKQLPIVQLGSDTSICVGSSLALNAFQVDITQYQWQDGSTTPGYLVTNAGTYSVTVKGNNGCINRDTIAVNTIALPSFTLGKDTSLCTSEILALNVNLSNAQYLWSTGATTNAITVSSPGWYWLNVTQNRCSKKDSIEVLYKPLPIVRLGNDTTLCEGITKDLDVSNAGATYLWQDNSTSANYRVSKAGLYHVSVNMNGCVKKDTIRIDYLLRPNFTLGPDRELCTGTKLVLDPGIRNGTFLWQDGSTSPAFTVTVPGIYSVTANNQCGGFSDEVTIVKGLCRLVMPNAFTPNDDRTNDVFRVKNPEFIKTFSLKIYNRWGQLIFQTSDPHKGWDGKFNGLPQPADNYVWVISMTDNDGNKESAKGSVLLLR